MFGEKIHRSAFLRQVPIYHSVYLGHYYGYTIWHVYQSSCSKISITIDR